MSAYAPPLADIRFTLETVADLPAIARLPGYQAAEPDLVEAILTEAGKLAAEVFAPLNQPGDQQGCRFENGVVRTPDGNREAYRQYVEGGWNSLPFDPAYGGQGLPWSLAMAVQEMWHAANLGFALCPLLTQGAAELLQSHGSDAQKALFLPKMVSGEWAATMNLTEAQAGSDVGAIKTKATPDGEHYRIFGEKIFISHGEHDLTENIVHLVLARVPEAPAGTKGISLFLVPKILVKPDGSLGQRNDLRCASIEHKLGINASPTAVMLYGENDGAIGYLIGEANSGMATMFTMMNRARLGVGVQGLAIAERAYQQALAFARERRQSREIGSRDDAPAPIIRHPDVRRMLMTMKAYTEAMRAMAYYSAASLDRAKREPDDAARANSLAQVALLTPVAKAWMTDVGCEVASIGLQVHGGMGFIEETGAAQHFRDARITPIYEGTNGIQALDLVMRKVAHDRGRAAERFVAQLREIAATLDKAADERVKALAGPIEAAVAELEGATAWLLETVAANPARVAAGASPYLRLFGTVAGGALLAQAAASAARRLSANGSDQAEDGDQRFLETKIATARFYADNLLPTARAAAAAVTKGADSTLALEPDQF